MGLKVMEYDYLLDDGTEGRVAVRNASLIAWDETRGKRQWPTATDAPMLWQTFIVWHALTRTGATTLKFDEFKQRADVIESVEDDESDQPDVDPTTEPDA